MKKSKFLKKSLAMLLALMLVVAMIPLSAAAATFDFSSIYVDGNKVEVGSTFTVDVPNTATEVKVGTNETLADYGYELRAVKATSTVEETKIDKAGTVLALNDYAKDNAITLKLYDITSEAKLVETYTMQLKKTSLRTTTNLASVTPGNGVYSAEFDNDKKEVYVVLARDDANYDDTAITVVAADGATAEQPANAAEGTTFKVTSESGNNVSEYTIVVREYADAITSFSVNGVEGVITDSDKDNIPDTITVTLPKTAVFNSYGDLIEDPEFVVEYAVYGNVTANANDVKIGGTAVASGSKFKFDDLGTNATWNAGDVVVTRLTTAEQTYDLVVELEKSDNTAITAARLDNTEAAIDGNKISAVLPVNKDTNNATKLEQVAVYLTVDATAKKVVIGGVDATKNAGYWSATVNLTKPVIVTVTAEDNSTQQYELSATIANEVKDASITAMWMTNGTTKVEGVVSGNTITLTVPYMTTSVADWKVYFTPSNGAKVLNLNGIDIVNGAHTGNDLNLTDTNTNASGISTTVKAVNKADQKVFKEYNVVVKLAAAKNGNTLTDLDFTAQQNDNDKDLFRNITKDNSFDANVQQATNLNHGVVSMMVPPSLMQAGYQNIVTNFETANGGVAFVVDYNNGTDYNISALKATTNDDNAVAITGSELVSYKGTTPYQANGEYQQIIVLPEEIARKVLTSAPGYVLTAADAKYGTIYDVKITQKTAETEALLKSFKVGNTTLTIDGNVIKGELPYSATVAAANAANGAVFAEFTMSKYAQMFLGDHAATHMFFSKGDTDGDGVANDRDAGNRGFIFVRGENNKVVVYQADADSSSPVNEQGISVLAENRLTNADKYSKTKYTFDLTYAEPCADADITSFKLGNYAGSINGRNITVTVPYGTDVKGMVANFTTSVGAVVELTAYGSGSTLVSGETSVNYTNPVSLYVTSENKMTQVKYTVTVEEGISFSDVKPGDWFYDNVMDAAQNGYVSGMGDGTFNPTGATTRAQFAAMIANAMGYDEDPNVESMFPDVADNYWGKAAINYCVQNGILTGYEDGTFQPEKAITRQEAAAILNNAFELAEKYGISTEKFPDNGAIADWAADHVYAAKAAGLMKGDAGTGNFRPTSTITRAEAASIMMNAKNAGLIK